MKGIHGIAASSHAPRACHGCARPLASGPAIARLISEGSSLRAVELCSSCAGSGPAAKLPEQGRIHRAVACTQCGLPAPLTSRAIAVGQTISVLCPRCSGDEIPAPPAAAPPRRRFARRARPLGALTAAAASVAIGVLVMVSDDSAAAIAASSVSAQVSAARLTGRDIGDLELRVPPKERPQVHDLSFVPGRSGEIPLIWYHPLAGERVLPSHPSRQFGAARPGPRPGECGSGHCGVDLGDERGHVVHAVRPGMVDRIMRTPDRLGGKYVRMAHPEGFFTYYMHLDVIRPTIVEGVEVAAGEPLGLLGSTGIRHSPPHLHFAVARILEGGGQRYVDPEPMLRQAVVLDEPAHFPEPWRRPAPRMGRSETRLRDVSGGREGGDLEDGSHEAGQHLEAEPPRAATPEPSAGLALDEVLGLDEDNPAALR
jgi:murein DD-endopeptidase MepM/ murein hydrolase activator NlpD